MKPGLMTFLAGLAIVGVSRLQLDVAIRLGANNIHGGPLILSVLVLLAGSFIGGLVALVGLIRLLTYALRTWKTGSGSPADRPGT